MPESNASFDKMFSPANPNCTATMTSVGVQSQPISLSASPLSLYLMCTLLSCSLREETWRRSAMKKYSDSEEVYIEGRERERRHDVWRWEKKAAITESKEESNKVTTTHSRLFLQLKHKTSLQLKHKTSEVRWDRKLQEAYLLWWLINAFALLTEQ